MDLRQNPSNPIAAPGELAQTNMTQPQSNLQSNKIFKGVVALLCTLALIIVLSLFGKKTHSTSNVGPNSISENEISNQQTGAADYLIGQQKVRESSPHGFYSTALPMTFWELQQALQS